MDLALVKHFIRLTRQERSLRAERERVTAAMEMEVVREYTKLNRRKRELEAELDAVKEQKAKVEERLLEEFSLDNVDRITLDGHTVYLHRQVWAALEEGATKEDVIEGFRAAGLEHFVSETYSHQTVSAWLRELEREGEELPEELDGLLGTSEKFSVRVRRS